MKEAQDIGHVINALVTESHEQGTYAQKNGVTYRLLPQPKTLALGEVVQGFAYENRQGQRILESQLPAARLHRYGFCEVVEVRRDLGVFVDIGLSEKEIAVSYDDLPSETSLWPKVGDRLLVKLTKDNKNRLWASLASDDIFMQIAKTLPPHRRLFQNQEKKALVYRPKIVGSYVLTEDFYLGFIHHEEFSIEPRLGEELTARVIGVGEFGALNLSLLPMAHEVLDDDARMILEILKREPGQRLPFHDKSPAEGIRQFFGISKAQFKRAIGRLYKAKKIVIQSDGIELVK